MQTYLDRDFFIRPQSKATMPLRRKGLLRVKDNEKTLELTANQILNIKQRINFYSCYKTGRCLNRTIDEPIYTCWKKIVSKISESRGRRQKHRIEADSRVAEL